MSQPVSTRSAWAGLVLLAAGAGLAGCDGSPAGVSGAATSHPCKAAVDVALASSGVRVDDMSNVLWQSDITGGGADRQLLGHRFQGRPPGCSAGDVTISLWPNCGLQQIRTRGGCTLSQL